MTSDLPATRMAWRLMKRPVGDIADDDLVYAAEPIPPLAEGQALLKVHYLSLDPTNRIWMSDMEQYMPPVPLGDIMRGGVVGTVVASRNPALKVGAVMGGLGGWTDYVVTDGTFLNEIPPMPGVPLAAAFGNFFIVGATAYFGLMDIGQPKPGETVVVSAAAGAVGSLVCQLAKMKGCRVIGIAGSDEKCRWLTEVAGIDGAINYKREDVGARLDALCPKGIDINFENVGGEIMEAVMARMNNFGRMALCGMISTYNATTPMPGPRAWPLILMHRLKVQGFIVSDYADRYPEAIMTLAQGMMSGQIKTQLDVRQGLDQAVNAVRELYTGGNNGKLMVAVHPEG